MYLSLFYTHTRTPYSRVSCHTHTHTHTTLKCVCVCVCLCVHVYWCACILEKTYTHINIRALFLRDTVAEYRLIYRALLQKRPIIGLLS